MAVHRTAVTTNGAVPSGLSAAKLEPLMTTTSTVQSQPTAQRPSAVSASKFVMQGVWNHLRIKTLEYRLVLLMMSALETASHVQVFEMMRCDNHDGCIDSFVAAMGNMLGRPTISNGAGSVSMVRI